MKKLFEYSEFMNKLSPFLYDRVEQFTVGHILDTVVLFKNKD